MFYAPTPRRDMLCAVLAYLEIRSPLSQIFLVAANSFSGYLFVTSWFFFVVYFGYKTQ